jgi:sugar phosphate permease
MADEPKKRNAVATVLGGAGEQLRFMVREARRYGELRQTPYGLTPFTILTIIGVFGAFEGQAISVASPDIGQDLHLQIRDLIGLSATVSVIGVCIGIFVAYYFDRHKRAPWVGIGTIVSGFAGMWTSQATSFAGVASLQTVDQGATLAIGLPLASLMADYYPPEARGRVFALQGLAGPIIGVTAAATIGPCIDHFGWRSTIFVTAFGVVLAGFYALFRLREPIRGFMERRAMGATDEVALEEDEPISMGEGWRILLKVRTLRRTFVAVAVGGPSEVALGLFFPLMLSQYYGLNATERSWLFLPSIITGLMGTIVGGSLIDYFSRR